MLEKSVGEESCREVLEKCLRKGLQTSVGEESCREE